MKLVIFGATGGTGRSLVETALAGGHDVVAAARRPEAVKPTHDRLRAVKADVLDPAQVAEALAGADAAISTIGPADNKKPGTLISEGVRNIVAGAQRAGVRRVVFESGLMLSDGHELSFVGRAGVAVFRALNRALYEDKVKAEAALRGSDLEWVIVRPPALVDGPARGGYIVGADARVNPAKSVPHADVADFLVRAAVEPQWARQTVNLGF